MNKITLIGNLTRDPELRTTQTGVSVCSFTIAVNRRRGANADPSQPEADFFRISAWRQLGEICAKYLAKGRKVAVTGSVSARTYQGNDGKTYVSLDVQADDVEFLSPKGETAGDFQSAAPAANVGAAPQGGGFVQVDDDELPF